MAAGDNEDYLQLGQGFQGNLGLSESNGNTTIGIIGREDLAAIALLQGVTDVTLESLVGCGSIYVTSVQIKITTIYLKKLQFQEKLQEKLLLFCIQ
jgi:hypothetical protein